MKNNMMKINIILVLAGAILMILFNGCTPEGQDAVNELVSSFPAAQTPVLDPPAPGDPTVSPKPVGAPFFSSRILKFHIPWPTVIEVAVDGGILKEQPQGCGDEGCYIVLSNYENPSGQYNYVIQVIPPAYKRHADALKFAVTDVSLNPNLTGSALASPPFQQIILEAVNPNLGGVPSAAATLGSPEWAATRDGGFLKYLHVSSPTDAAAYYLQIDPPTASNSNGSKTTLMAWKAANGFNPNDDSLDDARAVYFNGGDLEFGRSMHMKKQPNGEVAYYVSNYPTVEDARRGTNLIATVAMEYSPGPNGGSPFTKFYVFDKANIRTLSADLDGNGDKFVPGLCQICHSTAAPRTGVPGDLGARFIPFDLSSFQYSSFSGFARSDQEAAFKELNRGMLNTLESDATKNLIEAWYGTEGDISLPNPTQNSDAVPEGWGDTPDHSKLYLEVVMTSCRSCHVTRNTPVAFASYSDFDSESQTGLNFVCSSRIMPQAKVQYLKFWLQQLARSDPNVPRYRVDLLKNAGLSGWTSTGLCPQP